MPLRGKEWTTLRVFLRILLLVALCVSVTSFAHAEESTDHLDPLVQLLGQVDDPQFQLDLLTGMIDGLKGRRSVPMPKGWSKVYPKLAKSPNAQVRDKAKVLALVFGDVSALGSLRGKLMDKKVSNADRLNALAALVEKKDPQLPPMLFKLLDEPALRGAATRALAGYNDPKTPGNLLIRYGSFSSNDKRDALSTLASRVSYAKALLKAIEGDIVPARDLQAFTVRQMLSLGDKSIAERLKNVWGEIRETSADKAALKAKYTKELTAAVLKKASMSNGRAIFDKSCGQCHILYGEGGKVGPDITGSNRHNMDYLLENILDPNAAIGKDYQMVEITTTGFQKITGLILNRTPNVLTIKTLNDQITLPTDEVDQIKPTTLSMMPEGLLTPMKPNEVRDLIAYLQSHSQVALPSAAVTGEQKIEGESMRVAKITGGSTLKQGMQAFGVGTWSGDRQMWWRYAKPGHSLTLGFNVADGGEYEVQAVMTKARDYGIMQMYLNGKKLGAPVDYYNAPRVITTGVISFGKHRLDAGTHQLVVEVTGTNPKAKPKSHMFGLDYIKLVPVKSATSSDASVIFEDPFDGKLASGWSWIRHDKKAWRVANGTLQIQIQPGNMWGKANSAKNVLVRPVPDPTKQPMAIELTVATKPTERWEQAGMAWYYDDGHMVKLVRELVKGKVSIVMGREQNDRTKTIAVIPIEGDSVSLRLEAKGRFITGKYRVDPDDPWLKAGTTDPPIKGAPKISFQCYNGPPNTEHWATFSNFRIMAIN